MSIINNSKQLKYDFSVLMTIYTNNNESEFRTAIYSIVEQTYPPTEIVLVVDGKVTEALEKAIRTIIRSISIPNNVIWLKDNVGLSCALSIGLKKCKYNLIARMDADDYSVPDRFEKQLLCIQENPCISLVGSSYAQYDKSLKKYLGSRRLPYSGKSVLNYSKLRTPINHVTIMFNKSDLIRSGGYPNLRWPFEDWWIANRLLKNNYKIINIQEDLVYVRGGDDFIERRRGTNYFKSEIKNLFAMKKEGLLSNLYLVINIIIRSPVRLIPQSASKFIYSLIRS